MFIAVAQYSKNRLKPGFLTLQFPILLIIGVWLYLSLVSETGKPVDVLPPMLDLFDVPAEILLVFVSVVFVNSPTAFRIVRGLTLDVKTRDYVAAAQTRGEGPWYIMLWEILPNVRGPLIVVPQSGLSDSSPRPKNPKVPSRMVAYPMRSGPAI